MMLTQLHHCQLQRMLYPKYMNARCHKYENYFHPIDISNFGKNSVKTYYSTLKSDMMYNINFMCILDSIHGENKFPIKTNMINICRNVL